MSRTESSKWRLGVELTNPLSIPHQPILLGQVLGKKGPVSFWSPFATSRRAPVAVNVRSRNQRPREPDRARRSFGDSSRNLGLFRSSGRDGGRYRR